MAPESLSSYRPPRYQAFPKTRSSNQRTERSAAASYHRHALPRLQQHFRLNPVKSSTSNPRGSDRTKAAFECAVPANYLQEPPLPLLGKEGESALRWGGAYIALLAMCATRRPGPLDPHMANTATCAPPNNSRNAPEALRLGSPSFPLCTSFPTAFFMSLIPADIPGSFCEF